MAREKQGSPESEKKLEQYGVWVKVKPRAVAAAPALEDSFELSDLDGSRPSAAAVAAVAPEDSELTAEEEKLLDELETELDPEAASENVLVPEEEPLLSESELPDIESVTEGTVVSDIALGQPTDEELPELEEDSEAARSSGAEGTEIEVTLSENGTEQDKFGDLEALESELASVTTKHRAASSSSAEILSRIEEELRSIRTDLTQLRTELSGLRKTAGAADEEAPVSAEAQGGFFDEDEDETIALTGDELDNILNTAEITEEAAEVPTLGEDLDLAPDETVSADQNPQEDILSYETPAPEAAASVPEALDLELGDETAGTDTPGDDTLVLADDDILSTSDTAAMDEPALEELPSELVLDELAAEPAASGAELGTEGLPELDLEGIPEIETEPAAVESIAPASSPLDDEGSETIDLETLDLGEEPTVIDAVPEQVDELETLTEEETDVEPLEDVTAAEDKADESVDLAADVDLEALAAEAEELNDEVPVAPVIDDLEIGELESPPDEGTEAPAAEKEIEIEFESDLAKDEANLQESAEEAEEMQELIPELEELGESPAPAGKPAAAAAPAEEATSIPDNLKDEIRTVLKYMDHLLEALPDEKIQEFASSDYFVMYKKLFEDLGLGE